MGRFIDTICVRKKCVDLGEWRTLCVMNYFSKYLRFAYYLLRKHWCRLYAMQSLLILIFGVLKMFYVLKIAVKCLIYCIILTSNFYVSEKRRSSMCVGCGSPITDQYILRVSPDLEWHAACLKCADCHQFLDETCTCYVREGKTYCKRDYYRWAS